MVKPTQPTPRTAPEKERQETLYLPPVIFHAICDQLSKNSDFKRRYEEFMKWRPEKNNTVSHNGLTQKKRSIIADIERGRYRSGQAFMPVKSKLSTVSAWSR